MSEEYRNRHDGRSVFISKSETIDGELVLTADSGDRWGSELFSQHHYPVASLVQRIREVKSHFCEWFSNCSTKSCYRQVICIDPQLSASPIARIELTTSIVEIEGEEYIIGTAKVKHLKNPEVWTKIKEIKELNSFCLIRKI